MVGTVDPGVNGSARTHTVHIGHRGPAYAGLMINRRLPPRDGVLVAALAVAVLAEAWARWGEAAVGLGWSALVVAVARRRPGRALLLGAAANLVLLADL